jgi:hypothetical protein
LDVKPLSTGYVAKFYCGEFDLEKEISGTFDSN